MKKIPFFILLFLWANQAHAKLSIFACEPEWASLARAIVKDKMDIDVATNSNQNPQFVSVKSALVVPARRAKMIFCSGGDLEKKWLNRLINDSTNLAAVSDKNALLLAYDYVEKPKNIDEKYQYLLLGNRTHLNPHNVMKIAAEFTRRIKIIDPLHGDFYQENYRLFVEKMEKSIIAWEKRAQFLRGKTFLANDNSWVYLADWLKINIVTIYDPETGKKPNILKLNAIAEAIKANPIEAIIFAGWEDKRSLFWLRDTTRTRVILTPFSTKGPTDLFKLYDTILNSLLTDCSSGVCKTLDQSVKASVKFR